MARPKTPTSILEMRGSFKKNPQRARPNEPEPEGEIGPAPDNLDEQQAKAWDYLVGQIAPGVLTSMDRAAMELVACQYARLWTETLTVPHAKAILTMLGRFGLTPADRANVQIPPEPTANKYW